jgi:hypothetical protein
VDIEERLTKQDKKLECLEDKIDYIMQQVALGKHLMLFAKMMGWVIGVVASCVEAWRSIKGH